MPDKKIMHDRFAPLRREKTNETFFFLLTTCMKTTVAETIRLLRLVLAVLILFEE
jgi:hypothetical protein